MISTHAYVGMHAHASLNTYTYPTIHKILVPVQVTEITSDLTSYGSEY